MSGAELRRLRLALGLTQEQLAKELEVSESSVLRWEKGRHKISGPVERAIRAILASRKG